MISLYYYNIKSTNVQRHGTVERDKTSIVDRRMT